MQKRFEIGQIVNTSVQQEHCMSFICMKGHNCTD